MGVDICEKLGGRITKHIQRYQLTERDKNYRPEVKFKKPQDLVD